MQPYESLVSRKAKFLMVGQLTNLMVGQMPTYAGAVLEISLSSFQTACLSRTFAVHVRWDLRAEFPVMLQHKFL